VGQARGERVEAAQTLAEQIEALLKSGSQPADGRSAKEIVSELTEKYGRLEEQQHELTEFDAIGLDEERLVTLQKGIQRFAALARFG